MKVFAQTRLLSASVVLALVAGGASPAAALAHKSSRAAVIKSVAFAGSAAAPTITVTGRGFGRVAPTGYDDTNNGCGSYPNNGQTYGDAFSFADTIHGWSAGAGIPPGQNCIGLVVSSWTRKSITFTFGSAYGSFDHWTADQGDAFTLNLNGASYSSSVTYP